MKSTPQVVEHCHECLKWMIPAIDKLPKQRRFTMGEKLESALLDVLGLLTQAVYTPSSKQLLQQANQKLAVAVHLWRLCFELKLIDKRRYLHGAEMMTGIGRQIGGWIKRK